MFVVGQDPKIVKLRRKEFREGDAKDLFLDGDNRPENLVLMMERRPSPAPPAKPPWRIG
ncbi:hypothetical protein FACS1894186_4490 [Alphaproteobacteria bacterium]|nr:hypothetical protein FACS1894186_4490 [Alphaproteobacteria bacterium]